MYAIALTSVPPRLNRLVPVLESLLGQHPAPDAVHLFLPRVWDRFGKAEIGWSVPDGVHVHIEYADFGPCMKAICFSYHQYLETENLIYCDDDWIYPHGWAETLLKAKSRRCAAAASGFDVGRLKRLSGSKTAGYVDIAQGFGGVCVDPEWFDVPDIVPPAEARFADDIWLSGQLARQGIGIRHCPEARIGLRTAFEDAFGLQDMAGEGMRRAEVNWAALDLLTQRYGIWPAV